MKQLGGESDADKLSDNSPSAEIQRDIKESFEVGREDDGEMPNIWYPAGVLPGFKEVCLDFYRVCFEF